MDSSYEPDWLPEYLAVRSKVGLLRRPDLSTFVVTGADRLSFLDAMLSQALAKLSAGQGARAALLNVQGRIVADMVVHVRDSDVLIVVAQDDRSKLMEGLRRYVISEDVRLSLPDPDVAIVELHGPLASSLVAQIFQAAPGERSNEGGFVDLQGQAVFLSRVEQLGEVGFQILLDPELEDSLCAVVGRAHGQSAPVVGPPAAEALRIEAGTARAGQDFDESVILSEASLEDAVNYEKGCYLGQEVIARIKFRGHVNRRLVGLRIRGYVAPSPGARLSAGEREVGHITSASFSPAAGEVLALGYLRREIEIGARVAVEGRPDVATVIQTPFYQRAAFAFR